MRWPSRKSAKRQSSCPDESVLAAYADGLLEEGERLRAEEHLADCRQCLEQIGLLVQLSRSETGLDPVPEELMAKARMLNVPPASRRAVGRWVPAAAAAMLLLALLPWMALRYMAAPHSQERLLRSSPGKVELQVVAPHPESSLFLPLKFAWKSVPQAAFYSVLVVNSEGEPIWRGEATRTQITLPEDAPLNPGDRYFMRVRAQLPGGEEASSDFIAFSVRKAP